MKIEFIRERRKQLNLTQQAAADKCGMCSSLWRGIESGNKPMGLKSLRRILEALDLEMQIVPRNGKEKT